MVCNNVDLVVFFVDMLFLFIDGKDDIGLVSGLCVVEFEVGVFVKLEEDEVLF